MKLNKLNRWKNKIELKINLLKVKEQKKIIIFMQRKDNKNNIIMKNNSINMNNNQIGKNLQSSWIKERHNLQNSIKSDKLHLLMMQHPKRRAGERSRHQKNHIILMKQQMNQEQNKLFIKIKQNNKKNKNMINKINKSQTSRLVFLILIRIKRGNLLNKCNYHLGFKHNKVLISHILIINNRNLYLGLLYNQNMFSDQRKIFRNQSREYQGNGNKIKCLKVKYRIHLNNYLIMSKLKQLGSS